MRRHPNAVPEWPVPAARNKYAGWSHDYYGAMMPVMMAVANDDHEGVRLRHNTEQKPGADQCSDDEFFHSDFQVEYVSGFLIGRAAFAPIQSMPSKSE
jgi:hypothetical protein